MDPFARFNEQAKENWSNFAVMEQLTGSVAPKLVRFAGISKGTRLLDVGCGTGVVTLTAARLGAEVTGVDLTPKLLEHARENLAIAEVDATLVEGDVEELPFDDASFDVVVSQFGHMFAPRPQLAVAQMLRVLKPGGTIAFSTWPPELYVGRFLATTGRYAPKPPPEGMAPPPLWGDPAVVRERLGSAVRDLVFDRALMRIPALSPAHIWAMSSRNLGHLAALVRSLEGQSERLASLRKEVVELAATYFEDNFLRQDFLLTRAIKV